MMQQNQFSQEKQPFFKPLTNVDKAGSFFSFDSTTGKRNKTAESARDENVGQSNNTVQKNNQAQSEGTGRLSSLHAKLHQEADKIRRWKTQTEMELKKKESQVAEAVQTIDSLRKSMLELQLQNENLSLKLQDEKTNQEEIVRKIDATRNMCNLLKNHMAEMEDGLVQCETERTEVKYLEKTHSKEFEELLGKFKGLQISYKEETVKLSAQVSDEQESREKIQTELNNKLSQTEAQLQELMHDNKVKDVRIDELEIKLQNNQEALNKAVTEMDSLKNALVQTEDEYQRQSNLLESTLEDFKLTKAEKLTIERHCHDLNKTLDETSQSKDDLVKEFDAQKASHEDTLLCLREEINTVNDTLNEEKNRFKDLHHQYEKSQTLIEEIKSSRDILIMEKSEVQIQLSEMEKEKVMLSALHSSEELKFADLKEELGKVNSELLSSNERIVQCQNEADALKKQLAEERTSKLATEEEVIDLKKQLELKIRVIESLESEIAEDQACAEQLKSDIKTLEETVQEHSKEIEEQKEKVRLLKRENQTLEKEQAGKKKEITKLEKEVKKRQTSEEESVKKLTELMEENSLLRKDLEDAQEEFEKKWEEINCLQEKGEENAKVIEQQLAMKSKSATDLETKLKSLKADATAKNKQIKDLQKEVAKMEKEKKKALEEKEAVNSKCKHEITEMMSTVKNMERETKKAVEEKEAAKTKCEYEMGEMMSTLEKYKQDSQNIIAQKDKELSGLRAKVDGLKKEEDDKAADLKSELEEMKELIEEQKKEQAKTEKRAAKGEKEQKKKFDSIVKESSAKDVEITTLKKTIEDLKEHLQKEKTATVALQQQFPEPVKTVHAPSPKTPVIPKTPPAQVMKTPQRSILRHTSESSVSKKRRVVFRHDLDLPEENSDSSPAELMEIENKENLKPTDEMEEFQKLFPGLAPSFNDKMKAKPIEQKCPSNVRKTPSKSPTASKFFKNSPKHRNRSSKLSKLKGKEDFAWFDLDSVFGFGPED